MRSVEEKPKVGVAETELYSGTEISVGKVISK